MKVIIATNNKDKVVEIKKILNLDNWEFYTLADLDLVSDPEETAHDFLGNAMIKVESAHEAAKNKGLNDYAIMADDSGLCVDALDGGPGVYSARYADVSDEHTATYSDNNEKLLDALKDVPEKKRTAHFETVSVLLYPCGKKIVASGKCHGKIGFVSKGEHGFGYDPIFLPDAFDYKKTLAQVSRDDKLLISHRGESLRNLIEQILQDYKKR